MTASRRFAAVGSLTGTSLIRATTPRRRRTALLGSALLVAMLALGACSDASDDAGGSADMMATDGSAGAVEPDTAGEAGGGDAVARLADTSTSVAGGLSVIVTADVTLVDEDPARVRDRIETVVAGYGGAITDEASYNRGKEATQETHLTLRVPTEKLDAVVRDFRSFTTVTESHKTSEDVTTQVIDIYARVKSKQAALDRLRGFLTQTDDIDTLVRVESELANREAELESLLAQQAHLADRTSMATLSVSLTTPEAKPAEAGFVGGLEDGWDAFTSALRVGATALGAMLPFLVLLAVVAAPAYLLVRRRARSAAQASTAAGAQSS